MRNEILDILEKLNLPLSTIEKDLEFGNGLLGKIRKDESRKLSDENFQKLKEYYKLKTGKEYRVYDAPPLPKGAHPEPLKMPKPIMVVKPNGDLSLAPSPESLKKLEETIEKLKKDYGEGAIMRLGEKPSWDENSIPTGSLGLNLALGIGGLPRGRIVEIYGPESSGKTTLALHIIAEAQKKGGKCAFIDVEHAFDESYAGALGIKVEDLEFSQPDYGEQALEKADRLILTGAFSVVVIDSVAALVPKSELEGEMGDTKMGLQARLMSQACRKLTATINKTNTVCIFINQLRANIGNPYQQETTTGGNALKFYASIRLDVRKIAQLKDGEELIGNRVRIKVAKNKVAPPFKTTEFDILFGEGISKNGELIDIAVGLDIIKKSGSWYSYNEMKLGQGRESAKQMLKDHPAMAEEIETKIKTTVSK